MYYRILRHGIIYANCIMYCLGYNYLSNNLVINIIIRKNNIKKFYLFSNSRNIHSIHLYFIDPKYHNSKLIPNMWSFYVSHLKRSGQIFSLSLVRLF